MRLSVRGFGTIRKKCSRMTRDTCSRVYYKLSIVQIGCLKRTGVTENEISNRSRRVAWYVHRGCSLERVCRRLVSIPCDVLDSRRIRVRGRRWKIPQHGSITSADDVSETRVQNETHHVCQCVYRQVTRDARERVSKEREVLRAGERLGLSRRERERERERGICEIKRSQNLGSCTRLHTRARARSGRERSRQVRIRIARRGVSPRLERESRIIFGKESNTPRVGLRCSR